MTCMRFGSFGLNWYGWSNDEISQSTCLITDDASWTEW